VKDPTHLAVRPQFHWTDQKLRVHIFICLISYILARLVHHEARTRCGWTGSLSGLLNHLGRTRLAMVMQAAAQRGKQKITCNWILEEGDGGPSVFEHLVPPAPPFVYTHTVS
jgi:transposase